MLDVSRLVSWFGFCEQVVTIYMFLWFILDSFILFYFSFLLFLEFRLCREAEAVY